MENLKISCGIEENGWCHQCAEDAGRYKSEPLLKRLWDIPLWQQRQRQPPGKVGDKTHTEHADEIFIIAHCLDLFCGV